MADDRIVETARTFVVIGLAQGEPQPKGELSVAGQPERTFTGWIGLIAALESVVSSLAAGESGQSGAALSGDAGMDGG